MDLPLTLDTLNYLCEVVAAQTLSGADPDFERHAGQIANARAELSASVHAVTAYLAVGGQHPAVPLEESQPPGPEAG
jgi:hypothetical protein